MVNGRKINEPQPRALGDGQLQVTKTQLYKAPVLSATVIKTISIVNTDENDRLVNLYVNRTGVSRHILPKDTILRPGYLIIIDDEINLDANDILEGKCDLANVCDFTINGIEYITD